MLADFQSPVLERIVLQLQTHTDTPWLISQAIYLWGGGREDQY